MGMGHPPWAPPATKALGAPGSAQSVIQPWALSSSAEPVSDLLDDTVNEPVSEEKSKTQTQKLGPPQKTVQILLL